MDADILKSLSEILGGLLGDDSLELRMDSRREDYPDWDSLTYVNFIAMVEMHHGIKFRVSEIESFATVGAVVSAVRDKLAAK